ncbi:MAG: hypothetical protein HQL23_02115 [Candidatus Omnitrophica bacterium]|nr:hypothetical protein [Candidatus Omnitrophota bacterium]
MAGFFIRNVFKDAIESVQEINHKYAKPQIKMTPFVRFALITLRLYLILLVGILFFKFYTLLGK